MKNRPQPSQAQREELRLLANDLLTEANERGDLDWTTVTWAVANLLHRANKREPIGAMAA